MNQRYRQYQTSFSITNFPPDSKTPLRKIQDILGRWLISRERRYWGDDAPFVDFRRFVGKSTGKSRRHRSLFITDDYHSETESAWAFFYRHDDPRTPGLGWIVQVGIRMGRDQQRIIVGISLEYETFPDLIASGKFVPPISTMPHFVQDIYKLYPGATYSVNGIPISSNSIIHATIETEEEAKALAADIENPARLFPVVLLYGASEELKKEAKILGEKLLAKARVVLVKYNPGKVHAIVKPYAMRFNMIRVIFPYGLVGGSLDRTAKYQFPVFKPGDNREGFMKKIEVIRTNIITAIDAHVETTENDSVTTISDIRSLVRKQKITQLKEKLHLKDQELQGKAKLASDMAAENTQLWGALDEKEKMAEQKDNEYLEALCRNDALCKEIETMREDTRRALHDLSVQHDRQLAMLRQDTILPEELPRNIDQLSNWAEHLKNLCFTVNAWESAKSFCRAEKQAEIVPVFWHMLSCMNNVLYRLKFEERVINLVDEFSGRCPFTYSNTESGTSKKDGRIVQQRSFKFEGADYDMWKHIKKGEDIRIYFDFDEKKQRIIINSIGPHLTNAATKYRK